MKRNSFDTIINQKLSGHQSPVPADAWDNIIKRKKKKRYVMYWWFFGILLVSGAGIVGQYTKTNTTPGPGMNKNKENIKEMTLAVEPDTISSVTEYNKAETSNPENSLIAKQQNSWSKEKSLKPGESNDNVEKDASTAILPKTENASAKKTKAPTKEQQNILTGKTNLNLKEGENSFEKDESSVTISKTVNDESLKKKKELSAKVEKGSGISIEARSEPDIITINEKWNSMGDTRHFEFAKWKVFNPADSLFIPQTGWAKLHHPVIVLPSMNNEIATTTLEKKKNKWNLDVSVTPTLPLQVNALLLTLRRTTITTQGNAAYKANAIRTSLQPGLSYTIAVRKKIAKKLAIGAGLQYAVIKETARLSGEEINANYSVVQRLTYVNALPVLVNDTTATVTSGIRNIQAMNSYDFISLPFSVHYTIAENRRWALAVNGGLYLTIKANYKNSIDGNLATAYASVVKTSNTNHQFNTDIYAGMRLSRTLGRLYQLYVAPEFRFNTGQYVLPGMINYKSIHRLGVAVGFSYQFVH